MALNITQISNFFNVLTQETAALKNYHFGYRSDVERNINNNFDIGQSTGKLFPAVHFSVPEQAILQDDRSGIMRYACRLYFDNLQGYNNDSSTNTDSLLEQYTELLQIAKAYILNIDNIGREYLDNELYIQEIDEQAPLNFLLDAFAHRDRIISVYVDFTLVIQGDCDTVANINPTTRADWPLLADDYEKRGIFAVTGWNITGNDEIGTDVIAEFLGGLGGSFQGFQYLKNSENTALTDGTVTLTVIARDKYTTEQAETTIGVWTGEIGERYDTADNWTTAQMLEAYFGSLNNASHLQAVQFEKLLWAQAQAQLNAAAQELIFKLTYAKNEIVTGNANTSLTLPTAEINGLYSSPIAITINNELDMYIGEIGNTNKALSAGFVDRFYTGRGYATNNNLSFIARLKTTPNRLYFASSSNLYLCRQTGRDVNGFAEFDAPVLVGSYSQTAAPLEALNETSNGERILITGGGGSFALTSFAFNGINFNTVGVLQAGVFLDNGNGAISTTRAHFDLSNSTIFGSFFYVLTGIFNGISALTYTGDYSDYNNWARLDINPLFNVAPSLGGVEGNRGIWVDDVNTVNGYPVIYLANFTYHLIQRITANTTNPTTDADFNTITIAGQEGVQGNINGIGTAATFTSPFDLDGKDGILYVVQYIGGNNIRAIDLNTLEVTDYKGDYGVAGATNSQEY